MNSLKHSAFLSECTNISATILNENAEDVQLLFDALVEDLDPQTVLELTQAQAIAHQIVNQQRVGRLSGTVALIDQGRGSARWAVGFRSDRSGFQWYWCLF